MADEMVPNPDPIRITTARFELPLDPQLNVYGVEVNSNGRMWRESFGSQAEVEAFERGVRCGASMAANRFDVEVAEPMTMKVDGILARQDRDDYSMSSKTKE